MVKEESRMDAEIKMLQQRIQELENSLHILQSNRNEPVNGSAVSSGNSIRSLLMENIALINDFKGEHF